MHLQNAMKFQGCWGSDVVLVCRFSECLVFFKLEFFYKLCMFYNSSDGRVVKASASGAVDLGLIPS